MGGFGSMQYMLEKPQMFKSISGLSSAFYTEKKVRDHWPGDGGTGRAANSLSCSPGSCWITEKDSPEIKSRLTAVCGRIGQASGTVWDDLVKNMWTKYRNTAK